SNVWREPQVGGKERINGLRERMQWKYRSLHGSQKPLRLIDICIRCSTDPGDVVWEPFGGLCPAAISAHRLGRASVSAEIVPEFYIAARERLATYDRQTVIPGTD
ncbi:MAG: DNA methyltransferase, partial [Nitrospinota bacterium]